jgi:glutathione S-transferase
MKLHWSPKSPYVRKVMVAAHELGLDGRLELVRSIAMMNQPNPEIMADNPLNKIPTLVLDDGVAVYDSLTICEYFDHLGGGSLFPPPGPGRWEALTWHALADGLLDTLILWRNEREKPSDRRTQAWLAAFALKTNAALDRMEGEAPRIGAVSFGIGHIAIGCCLGYLDFRFADLDWRRSRPGLAAWFETFSSRPSAIATQVVDG